MCAAAAPSWRLRCAMREAVDPSQSAAYDLHGHHVSSFTHRRQAAARFVIPRLAGLIKRQGQNVNRNRQSRRCRRRHHCRNKAAAASPPARPAVRAPPVLGLHRPQLDVEAVRMVPWVVVGSGGWLVGSVGWWAQQKQDQQGKGRAEARPTGLGGPEGENKRARRGRSPLLAAVAHGHELVGVVGHLAPAEAARLYCTCVSR